YFEAIQDISRRTREETDPRKVGAVLADVFRGAGEDAGKFIFTLDEIGTSFDELTEEQEKYRSSSERLLEAQEDLNDELVQFANNWKSATANIAIFTAAVSTRALQVLNEFLGTFIKFEEAIDNFDKGIQTLSLAQLEEELKRLEKEPTFFERLGAAPGGILGLTKQASEFSSQVALIKIRIDELKKASEDAPLVDPKKTKATTETIVKASKAISEVVKELEASDEVFKSLASDSGPELQAQFDDQISDLENHLIVINETRKQAAEDEKKRKEDGEEDLKEFIIESAIDLGNQLFDLRRSRSEAEIAMLENQMEAELHLAGSNAEARALIETKFLDK
ncbi:MAG: hypothetical protein KAR20_28785, partial [Candidatus Heimdallarchaeota archaeon]|nr:hypothetical protein [Candidatus Heimdallarchaeota archaeon]